MRVLFVHPSLDASGGGNGVACWMVQALKDEHEVTALTWTPLDWERANRLWGTEIRTGDVASLRVPRWLRALVRVLPAPVALMRTCILLRLAKRLAPEFDCVVTANNEGDFGRVGVQYVHFPWNLFPRPDADLRWYHLGPLLPPYYALCKRIADFDVARARKNITLVNSDWTRRMALDRADLPSRTVYPPVKVGAVSRPWAEREDGFVCIGRFSPEKRLERVIEIVDRVRAQLPGVKLHLAGTRDNEPYYRQIVRLVRATPWITLHEDLSRDELEQLMARQRYGLHGMLEEHFGMAPAEMVRAGCIVWVPNGGGQVEIVDHPRLVYESVDDAAAKIVRTLGDPTEQDALRGHLAARADAFSPEAFVTKVRASVAEAAAA